MSGPKNGADWICRSVAARISEQNIRIKLMEAELVELRRFKYDHSCEKCSAVYNGLEYEHCNWCDKRHCYDCVDIGYKRHANYICIECYQTLCQRCCRRESSVICTECNDRCCLQCSLSVDGIVKCTDCERY